MSTHLFSVANMFVTRFS